MPTAIPTRIRLLITCEAAPPTTYNHQPTEFGLQDKQQVLYLGVPQPDGTLCFSCEVIVKLHAATGAPDFSGPFVHGQAGARFLYLGWRTPEGAWIKRFKIPLAAITREQIEAVQVGALVARLNTTRSGTVALLGAGWTLSDER